MLLAAVTSVAVDAAVDAAATNQPEGVPPWVIYLGGAIVTPLVAVLVAYLRRRLGVQDDTAPGNPPAGQAASAPADSPPPEDRAPAERYDARMALIDRMVKDQDERIDRLERELAEVRAERDRLWWMLRQPPPPPGPPWTPGPLPGPLPGS